MNDVFDELFAAENSRNWTTFRSLLHPEVQWTIVGPEAPALVEGRAAYTERIKAAYEFAPAAEFTVCRSLRNEEGTTVKELIDHHRNVSVDVFDICNGLVRREWEFLLGMDAR